MLSGLALEGCPVCQRNGVRIGVENAHGTAFGADRILLGDQSLVDETGQINWRGNELPNGRPVLLAKTKDQQEEAMLLRAFLDTLSNGVNMRHHIGQPSAQIETSQSFMRSSQKRGTLTEEREKELNRFISGAKQYADLFRELMFRWKTGNAESSTAEPNHSALFEFLERNKSDRVRHPEKAGGTHFETWLYPSIPIVEKIPHSRQVIESVQLAEERLGGLTIGFITAQKDGKTVVYMDSIPSLKTVLKGKIESGNMEEADSLLRKFFEVNIEIIKRGVVNWDPKIENYGVTPKQDVVLLDIGGLSDAEDVVIENDVDDSDVFFFHAKLGEGIPPDLKGVYQRLRGEFGLEHGGAILATIVKNRSTVSPERVVWKPATPNDQGIFGMTHHSPAIVFGLAFAGDRLHESLESISGPLQFLSLILILFWLAYTWWKNNYGVTKLSVSVTPYLNPKAAFIEANIRGRPASLGIGKAIVRFVDVKDERHLAREIHYLKGQNATNAYLVLSKDQKEKYFPNDQSNSSVKVIVDNERGLGEISQMVIKGEVSEVLVSIDSVVKDRLGGSDIAGYLQDLQDREESTKRVTVRSYVTRGFLWFYVLTFVPLRNLMQDVEFDMRSIRRTLTNA